MAKRLSGYGLLVFSKKMEIKVNTEADSGYRETFKLSLLWE